MLRDKAISCAHKKSSEVSKSIVDNFLLFWDNLNWKLVVLLKHSLNYFRTFDSAFISIAIERKNRWVGGHKFYNFYRRFYTPTCTLIALFLSFFLLRSLTPSLSQFQFCWCWSAISFILRPSSINKQLCVEWWHFHFIKTSNCLWFSRFFCWFVYPDFGSLIQQHHISLTFIRSFFLSFALKWKKKTEIMIALNILTLRVCIEWNSCWPYWFDD